MAKPKTRRLKVYQARFGFYDSVVAAPSQVAALRAWGTHQNLFAEGLAAVTEDETAARAACAHPDVPLRRALGSDGPFEVEPTSVPVIPDIPGHAAKRRPARVTAKDARQPRPDRSRLDAAERAVKDLDDRWRDEDVSYRSRLADLQAEMDKAQRTFQRRRSDAVADVSTARDAFRKAGGEAD